MFRVNEEISGDNKKVSGEFTIKFEYNVPVIGDNTDDEKAGYDAINLYIKEVPLGFIFMLANAPDAKVETKEIGYVYIDGKIPQ